MIAFTNIIHMAICAVTLKYSNDAIRRLIGPLGALKRKIEGETGMILYRRSPIVDSKMYQVLVLMIFVVVQ